jgi:hypothetical protein
MNNYSISSGLAHFVRHSRIAVAALRHPGVGGAKCISFSNTVFLNSFILLPEPDFIA